MENNKIESRTIDSLIRQYPDLYIKQWFFPEDDNFDLITVYTDQKTLTVQYNSKLGRSIIIGMIDGVPEECVEQGEYEVKSNNEKTEKTKGGITGFLAMSLTFIYALIVNIHYSEILKSSTVVVLLNYITPNAVCVFIADIFALIGFFEKKRWAMLTSGILMCGAWLLTEKLPLMLLVPSVLFIISYIRMGVKT